MKIHDDHMYHGAALTQIAESPQFTAINAFQNGNEKSRSGFLVNHDIGIYLKYASKPTKAFGEYVFTFTTEHLEEIEALSQGHEKVFIVFVCVQGKEICCLRRDELEDLIEKRREARGDEEPTYGIPITIPKGKSFRVYVNAPAKKKTSIGEKIVSRNRFPEAIFNE